ncbi:MAG: hypothetical protein V2I82_10315 [Halieaceae bacterium]|jgi:hypothetical protein|nr:hypothetical protein [Halieaceae bacterium]
MNALAPILAMLCLLSWAGVEAADEGDLRVHGFAAIATVHTDENSFFGDSQDWSTDFFEAGLNASYRVNSRVMVAGQVLARRAGELYDGSPQIDYALANIGLWQGQNYATVLRLGRIKNPLGLYNETRDVPFTRPSIFLPQSVYFDETRNALLATDGATLAGEYRHAAGNIAFSVGVGRPQADENAEWTLLGADLPGRLDSDYDALMSAVSYRSPDEKLQLGLSRYDVSLNYEPAGAFDLPAGTLDLSLNIASARYDAGIWTATAEYLYLPQRRSGTGPFLPFTSANGESYYLQGELRLGPRVTLLGRFERGASDRSDRRGLAQSATTGGLIPPFDFFDRGLTAGLTFQLTQRFMLRSEYSRREGTYILSARENPPAGLQKDWHYFAVQAALRF